MDNTAHGPAVLAEGLRERYGETHALDGVDLIVERTLTQPDRPVDSGSYIGGSAQ